MTITDIPEDRRERAQLAIRCLPNEQATNAFFTLLRIFPEAAIFWDEDDNSATLEVEEFSITIQ